MNKDHSLLYLSKGDIEGLGGDRSELYVRAVGRALELHAKGDFVQPLKPYLRANGKKGHIADRIIAMPAHVGGETAASGLKWIGSKHDNPALRGMERASGLIVLNDPETNYPVAIMEAGLISGMRTAAVTALAARHLAREGFRSVSCVGCGVIARMQLRALIEQFSQLSNVHLFDLDEGAARRLAGELQETFPGVTAEVEGDAEGAIRRGEVVVTCTVVDAPYVPFEWLREGAFVSNVSVMDLHKDVFLNADKVVVDDWDQANREKKVLNQLVEEGRFSREALHAELGEILIGEKPGRESDEEIIVLNPMGMAVEDIASAQEIYLEALAQGAGTRLSLF